MNVDEVIKMDHHPNVTPVRKGLLCGYNYSQVLVKSWQVAFDDMTPFQMNRGAANVIYTGIIGDTGRFLYQSTTSKLLHLYQN